jgi:hypothetical protein
VRRRERRSGAVQEVGRAELPHAFSSETVGIVRKRFQGVTVRGWHAQVDKEGPGEGGGGQKEKAPSTDQGGEAGGSGTPRVWPCVPANSW